MTPTTDADRPTRETVLTPVLLLLLAFSPGCSAPENPQCADNAESSKAVMNSLSAAKQSLADGHNAQSKQQSRAIEKLASTCIDAGDNVDIFHYIHAYSAMIEAQARMASGDVNGMTIFETATAEAQALANKSDVDPDVQKMATTLVSNAHIEMKEIKAAKPGQLIIPPASPSP